MPPLPAPRGMAIVMVLSCVVLVSMLVVSFLMLVRTDQQSSSAFAVSAETRLLSDIPINMAIGQIRRGTEQLGYTQTWASQPGMIRTYGLENDGSGQRARATGLFKLYSDDRMVVNTGSNVTATSGGLTPSQVNAAINEDINDLATWNTRPGMFTDINEPVPVRVGTSNALDISFPIVDPRALTPGTGALPVDGFSIDSSAVPGTQTPAGLTDTNTRLPMPVKWLYILKDGSFTTPASATGDSATFSGNNVPTADNPIVGRVAFWTDDESCKINVNTATEGTPWYPPLTTNTTDRDFAERIPAHNEFSAQPGHPAQTSLSPVFQVFDADLAVTPDLSTGERRERLEFYHNISPRVGWGGTLGGTRATPVTDDIPAKTDRLYPNLDELLLTTNRQLQSSSITSSRLALARFFLSAQSRAPEMCLFNKFRYSLWPNWESSSERTSLDNILELVNSSGVRGGGSAYQGRGTFDRGLGWSFLRKTGFSSETSPGSSQIAVSSSGDYPANAERLLTGVLGQQTGTSVVGAATNHTRIPGFGNASFIEKYGKPKRDQILGSMVDLMRSGIDAYRPALNTKHSYTPPQNATTNSKRLGEYSVFPLSINTTGVIAKARGFGRVPTISEVAIVFMATEANATGTATKMQAFLVLEPFAPFTGPPAWSANLRYEIRGLENLKVTINGTPHNLFPAKSSLTNQVNFNPDLGNKTPFPNLLAQFAKANESTFKPKDMGTSDAAAQFPFLSDAIDLNNAAEFGFSGATLTIVISSGWANNNETLQTLTVHLMGSDTPAPYRIANFTLKAPAFNASYSSLPSRLAGLNDNSEWHPETLIRSGDIVRSMQASGLTSSPARGDLRFFCGQPSIPANYFAPTGAALYTSTANERVHGLRDGSRTSDQNPYNASPLVTAGSLLRNANYDAAITPAAPENLASARKDDNLPGDWDNGIGDIEDGPYVNRADTGSRWFGSDGGYYGRSQNTIANSNQFERTFSIHRNAASAVVFGSIPTGINPADPADTDPWQTLLFCPNPPSRRTPALSEPTAADHKGFDAPRDHLLLDFFCMPVVQPYAVSEALSTAGRINMNYRMLPFPHIERSTGIHAAMKATRVTAISRDSIGQMPTINHYKDGRGHPYEIRYFINVPETLKGFKHRFDNHHDIFRSASEICEIFLVPQRIPGKTYAADVPSIPGYEDMNRWWNGNPSATSTHALDATGDNTREAPYNDLYPKLTTRSNTYTVHYRVQTLQKARSTSPATWVENQDIITGEHRGSALLERYIDPNNYQVASINQGGNNFADSWDGFFRFRIISRKDFTP